MLPQAYISSIVITNQTATITIGDNGAAAKLTAVVDLINPPDNGVVPFLTSYGRPGGVWSRKRK
jgi:hypothetical protein